MLSCAKGKGDGAAFAMICRAILGCLPLTPPVPATCLSGRRGRQAGGGAVTGVHYRAVSNENIFMYHKAKTGLMVYNLSYLFFTSYKPLTGIFPNSFMVHC